MNSSSNSQSMSNSTPTDASGKKVRKPYTITKSRESWTDEEHDKFLEALQLVRINLCQISALLHQELDLDYLQLKYMRTDDIRADCIFMFDRDWKKIEDFVGSKTVIQREKERHSAEIRSHAQKYFLKVQKNGAIAHVPPPRPKRKATHPYPQKAPKNVLLPLEASMAYPSLHSLAPGYSPWDDTSMLINSPSSGIMPTQDEYNLHGVEVDMRSKGAARISNIDISGIGNSSKTLPISELTQQGKQGSPVHGIPDFAEVYSFIGSVFDPETKGHVQKLKEMDPINFETVLLLMRNLTVNLSSPDFESIRNALSSNDMNFETVGVAASDGCQEPEQ
ncbi:hypothetical protein LguiB_035190 [Lonicera macranthoides]